jgi:hypothetical protein
VAILIVDALEVVNVEHDEGQLGDVAHGVGDFRFQTLVEVLAVEGPREPVAHARLVHPAQHAFFLHVRHREAEPDGRAELDLVSVGELLGADCIAVDEGAVSRLQVLDEPPQVPLRRDPGVGSAHAGVVNGDAHLPRSAEYDFLVQTDDAAGLGACEHGERGAIPLH